VEENYKRLKMWVGLENFTGKSVLSVKQDFYARVLSSNLVAMMSNTAQRLIDRNTKSRRLPYQVNFEQAISKMKNILIKLILLSNERLKKRLTDLIGYITCTLEPVRPNRSYDRKSVRQTVEPSP
jgi:hypothetical protein